MIKVPVLIIGAGPVGLTLALALSQLGIRSLVLNDRRTTTSHPKLDVVNCRSMEIFRQLGLAADIRSAGNPVCANQYSAMAASASGPFYSVMRDRHLVYRSVHDARQQIEKCTDGSLPLEPMQRIAQMNLEPILLSHAQADPNIEMRMGWRLYGFEQSSTGVVAMAHQIDSGEGLQLRSQFLIGCDGPNSRVRNFLNIDYDGTRDLVGELFIIHLRSDQIADLYPHRQPYWHTWLSRPGFGGLLVSPDAGRNDYVLHRPFAPRAGESLEAIVDAALGTRVEYEIIQSGPWRPQFLVANSFGRDRVFIAGDATHQFMPTGGLGMNTGVAEAQNLAWKLAACVQGWGGAALLESYEAERLPVARRNRNHVKKCAAGAFEAQFNNSAELLAQGPSGERVRCAMGQEFEKKVSRMYESLGVEIGYRYYGSPVVSTDSAQAPDYDEIRYTPTTWPGARLPSAWCSDGRAVYDLLAPGHFTLMVMGVSEEAAHPLVHAAHECRVPLQVLRLDDTHLAHIYERCFVLVRPDQHVCWRGETLPDDCQDLMNLVRGAR